MKIEFIKETRENGTVFFHTEIDGHYVENSTSTKDQVAHGYFKMICESKAISKSEILETVEIN